MISEAEASDGDEGLAGPWLEPPSLLVTLGALGFPPNSEASASTRAPAPVPRSESMPSSLGIVRHAGELLGQAISRIFRQTSP